MKGKLKGFEPLAANTVADEFTKRHTERTLNIFEDTDYLQKLAKKWSGTPADKAQGHLFEQIEVSKFNLDALRKDSELFARTTESMGSPHDPVDIIISDGKNVLREVQAKSCNSSARSAFSLSDEKYREMARLAPKDQVTKIEELLNNRIEKGTLKASDYEDTRKHLLKTLSQDDVASSGTTYQESLGATDVNESIKIANSIKLDAALSDMHQSGKMAGNINAGLSGSIEAVTGVYKITQGEANIGKVISNVAITSSKAYVTGYASAALSKGIIHSSTHFMGGAIGGAIAKSNAPTAIAVGVTKSAKSLVSYLKGDIDSETLFDEVNHTAITSATSFYYGALGQVMIPIPVVGALVGSGVGYYIGNILHQSGLIALGECAVVKISRERRESIEAMCLELIPRMREERLAFEASINKHFSDRAKVFKNAFNQVDEAYLNWDSDTFVNGLTLINEQFTQTLKYAKFEDFDEFMLSDAAFEF